MATGVLLYQQVDANTFRYNVDLKDSGDTAIGTFWYSWVPGEDFLGVSPTNIVSPAGWTAIVTHAGATDGFAIQWVNHSGPLQPGATLSGFGFDSTNTPTQLSGNSPLFPTTPLSTSFVYIGAPLTDAGDQFNVTPTTQPWRNPFAPLDVNNSGGVTPLDALQVINALLATGNRTLGIPTTSDHLPPFLDVNGDGKLSPLDALNVINDLLLNGAALPQAAPLAAVPMFAMAAVVPEPDGATLAFWAAATLAVASACRRARVVMRRHAGFLIPRLRAKLCRCAP